jgi:HTH-type transcriptional regulator/antitoxin HigA
MSNLIAAEVFPPGEILREELETRGWTQTDLAEILGRPVRLVNEIIAGKRAITPETAKGFEEALGVDARFWLNLESAWQLSRVRREDSGVARRAKLYEKAPIKEMIRRNWIEASADVEVLETRLLSFLGIASLDEVPDIQHAARKSGSYAEETSAQRAWLCRARQLARELPAERFSKGALQGALTKLRQLLPSAAEIQQVPEILADAGVRLVIVEPLASTRIDGACFWLDAQSPVVALSLRYDRIDWFWFTLMHELEHIKAGDALHDVHMDTDLVGEGSADSKKPERERAVNRRASERLVDGEALALFIARVRPRFHKERIRSFAAQIGVHPGIVVGQLQYRGEISYAHNREMLAKVRNVITRAAFTDGWGCNVPLML